jgi:PAS domain S-box-containing protein
METETEIIRMVLDALPVGIFWKDKNSVFLGCNAYTANHAGVNSPAEIIGKTDYDLSWAQYADKYQKDDQDIIKSGEIKQNYFEETIITANGSHIWVRTTKMPLVADGEIVGIIGIYQDITEIANLLDNLSSVLENASKKVASKFI